MFSMENLSYVAEKVTIIEPIHGTILTAMTIINRRYDLCPRIHNHIYIYIYTSITHICTRVSLKEEEQCLEVYLKNLATVLLNEQYTYIRIFACICL